MLGSDGPPAPAAPAPASRWRLVVALIAFALWAHPSLVGLPCAALLVAAPDRRGRSLPLAGLIGAASVALLLVGGGSGSRLAAVTSAYIVLVTAAFVAGVLLRPAPFLRQALRAMAVAGVATALLIQIVWGRHMWGTEGWATLAWEATRQAGLTMRFIVERAPDAFRVYEPVVRFVSVTWPGMLALQTLAGLALAWQLHLRLTSPALGAPLTRFRDFRIGDAWVWGMVAWLGVLILPVSGALQVAGTNLGLVAGTLYVLRGAAIVAVFAEAFGVSATALAIAAGAAAALAVPMLFVLPGLCTLGITDTWYQYRRRLAARRSNAT
ncbi:MAG TPA: DUF2232 domain-containing protein [Gemmatimonadales bacterium]|nr:DUF2232 domain-containing protein [Gemmatimonadales bacterium]